jgi:hypothetical protein
MAKRLRGVCTCRKANALESRTVYRVSMINNPEGQPVLYQMMVES